MSRKDLETKGHPSYGVVQISRCSSSGTNLVGSAVDHREYISITVREAEIWAGDDDHEQRMFPGKVLVSVGMTEAQFAEAITRFNMGEGTPCTLQRRQNPEAMDLILVEPPPKGRTMKDNFEALVDDVATDLGDDMRLRTAEIREITKGRLTKKGQVALDRILSTMDNNFEANLRYAVERLHEVSEKALTRAKVEMEAAGRSVLERIGLGAMADQVKNLLPGFDPEGSTNDERSNRGALEVPGHHEDPEGGRDG